MNNTETSPRRYLLSKTMFEIADLVGRDIAEKIMNARAGTEIFIPSPQRITPDHWLARLVGIEAALAIARRFSKTRIKVPVGRPRLGSLLPPGKIEQIRLLRQRGLSKSYIAWHVRCAYVTVERWFNRFEEEERASRSFRHQDRFGVDHVFRLHALGFSKSYIACRLGVSDSVINKVFKNHEAPAELLDVVFPLPDEIASDHWIARTLGLAAAREVVSLLGAGPMKFPKLAPAGLVMTNEEIETVLRLKNLGLPIAYVARIVGRHASTVHVALKRYQRIALETAFNTPLNDNSRQLK